LLAILGTAARRILWAGFAALGRQSRASTVAVATLATVVILDLVLIPSHGAAGAAWASLVAYWLGGILLYGSFRRMSRSIVERTIGVTDVPTVDVRIWSLWQRK
jgi:peptidoglycan biosynthesis protein MviN/MurJ (putative lipid II flippase)